MNIKNYKECNPTLFLALLLFLTFFPFFLYCLSPFLAGVIFGLRGCLFSFKWLQLSAGISKNPARY